MINLNSDICFKIKEARRAAKLSQTEVANEVGCKQSALCMFEQGDGTKLNDEVIEKLAKKFNVALAKEERATNFNGESGSGTKKGYCPNVNCPTNRKYDVDGQTFILPDRETADPVGGKFCAMCGEVLQKNCPNCGADVHDGAVCSYCGEKYLGV